MIGLLNRLRRWLRRLLGADQISEAIARQLIELRTAAGIGPQRPTYAYLGDHRGLVVLQDGAKLFVDTRDLSLAPSLIVHGYWENWIDTVVRRLARPGAIAVDVGANFGYYTLGLARIVGPTGRVHAFEANPHLAAMLADTVAINGYGDRVTVRNAAVFDRRTRLEMRINPRYLGGSHVLPLKTKAPLESIEVEAVTLSDALAGVERIDLLRMDIEGAEPYALRGAERLIRASPDIVIVAEWRVDMVGLQTDIAELVGWLVGLGFAFWEIKYDATLAPVAPEAMAGLAACDVVMARRYPL